MGMLPLRMCSRCHATAEPGSSQCAKHKAAPDTRQRNELRPKYKCKAWRLARLHVLTLDPQCTIVENGTRCPRLATDVHHRVPAELWMARGEDFYDLSNLFSLCHEHHSSHTAREQGFAVGNMKQGVLG